MKPLNKYLGCAATLAAAMTAGCALTGKNEQSATQSLMPRQLAEIRSTAAPASSINTDRPTVALVLGGGGLRGFAHVGALRALEEAGIRPDIVVGTSAGSVVGAAYASGMDFEKIKSAALNVKVSSLMDFTLSSSGIMRGNKLASWVNTMTGDVPIEQFPIRFAAVATDLQSGQAVLIGQGSAGRAIQASSAVPGVNVPIAYKAGHLIDGGITSLVPVRFARAMGADVVIAVDIYCHGPRAEGLGVPTVLSRVMQTQSCLVAAAEMAEADVLIAPKVGAPNMSTKEAQERVIQAGYEAARAALKKWQPGQGSVAMRALD
jgi:NTE family protein